MPFGPAEAKQVRALILTAVDDPEHLVRLAQALTTAALVDPTTFPADVRRCLAAAADDDATTAAAGLASLRTRIKSDPKIAARAASYAAAADG